MNIKVFQIQKVDETKIVLDENCFVLEQSYITKIKKIAYLSHTKI